MERVLKITEVFKPDSKLKDIRLNVVNERGQDLQGTITVNDIDKVEHKMQENKSELFFVYNPAKEKPTFIHTRYEDAQQEAVRISQQFDEGIVYILQIVGKIDKSILIKEIRTDRNGKEEEQIYPNDEIPF